MILRLSFMGLLKKPPAAFSPFFRAHVLNVRSARKTSVSPCGMNQAMRGLADGLF